MSMKNLPHPVTFLEEGNPQLNRVIAELEAGTYPQPDVAVWRCDLSRSLAIRVAKATGATDEQIAEMVRQDGVAVRARQAAT